MYSINCINWQIWTSHPLNSLIKLCLALLVGPCGEGTSTRACHCKQASSASSNGKPWEMMWRQKWSINAVFANIIRSVCDLKIMDRLAIFRKLLWPILHFFEFAACTDIMFPPFTWPCAQCIQKLRLWCTISSYTSCYDPFGYFLALKKNSSDWFLFVDVLGKDSIMESTAVFLQFHPRNSFLLPVLDVQSLAPIKCQASQDVFWGRNSHRDQFLAKWPK